MECLAYTILFKSSLCIKNVGIDTAWMMFPTRRVRDQFYGVTPAFLCTNLGNHESIYDLQWIQWGSGFDCKLTFVTWVLKFCMPLMTTSELQGTGFFLRSTLFHCWSQGSLKYVETEGSFPWSQKSVQNQLNPVNDDRCYFFNAKFAVILPSMPLSSERPLSFRFAYPNRVYFCIRRSCDILHPSRLSCFDQ